MQQFPSIDIFNQLYMFRAMFSPILRSTLTLYTALVQCTDLLLTGDTVEMELHFHPDPPRKLSKNLYDIYHC
jgi:hypothetical protein